MMNEVVITLNIYLTFVVAIACSKEIELAPLSN